MKKTYLALLISIIAILFIFTLHSYSKNTQTKIATQTKNETVQKPSTTTTEIIKKESTDTEPIVKEIEKTGVLELSDTIKNRDFYLPVLMFHYVKDIPSTSSDQIGYRLSISPKNFESYLQYFQENDIETITFWDVKNYLEGKAPLPKKYVILSFDDGHIEHYTIVLPLLKKYNMKGVFYIITDFADTNQNHVNTKQIQELAAAGNEIGSHTKNHFDLRTLGKKTLTSELVDSKAFLERITGTPVISFCSPAGKYNNQTLQLIKDNYIFARTTKAGSYFSINKKHLIPTIRIFPTTGTTSLSKWFLEKYYK